NAQQRLQHIGDMRLFLDKTLVAATEQTVDATPQKRTMGGKLLIGALAAALIAAMIPAALYFRRAPVNVAAMRFDLLIPGLVNNAVVLSPDGQKVVFLVQSPDGQRTLWVRSIGSDKAQQISGTENANGFFWSGDSKYIGFIVAGKLKKIDPTGGSVQDIA